MMKNEKRNMGTGGLPVAFDLTLKGRACSLHRRGRPEFGWKGLSGSVEVNRRLVMLSDAKARPYPWLLGTDLHAQQGAVEVMALKWDATRMRLSGLVSRPAGESGNLFLLMPRNMRLMNHEGTGLLKELLDFNVIIRVPVEFKKDTVNFEFFFEPWELTPLAPRGLLYYSTEKEWREHMKRNSQLGDTRVYE